MKKTVIAIITIIALAAFTGCDPALSTAALGKDESPVITVPADDDPKAPSITDDGSGNAPVGCCDGGACEHVYYHAGGRAVQLSG